MRAAWLGALAALAASPAVAAEPADTRIGDVSTTFRVLGRNDKIVVDRYDDPRVDNVSCYMFSIACRATGPVAVHGALPDNEVVFGASANWAFKEIRVSRMVDKERGVLVYLVWSTQALSKGGSPYNSVSAVPFESR